jgi:hypothetical protein
MYFSAERFRDVGELGGGKTVVVGLPEGKDLPDLPPGGLKTAEDAKGLKVVDEIDYEREGCLRSRPQPICLCLYSRDGAKEHLPNSTRLTDREEL